MRDLISTTTTQAPSTGTQSAGMPWGIVLICVGSLAALTAAVFTGYAVKYGLPCKKRQIQGPTLSEV